MEARSVERVVLSPPIHGELIVGKILFWDPAPKAPVCPRNLLDLAPDQGRLNGLPHTCS